MIDGDEGRARFSGGGAKVVGVDSLVFENPSVDISALVEADGPHQGDFAALSGGGDGLIRPFSAPESGHLVCDDGFARTRKVFDPGDIVEVQGAHDDDLARGLGLGSGGFFHGLGDEA